MWYSMLWAPWGILKKLMKNPFTLFIYGIISKWYMIVMFSALMTTYWVFKGLEEAGVLQAAQKILVQAVQDTKAAAQHCVPKIKNLQVFWDCLSNPPVYRASAAEQALEQALNQSLEKSKKRFEEKSKRKNPYEYTQDALD